MTDGPTGRLRTPFRQIRYTVMSGFPKSSIAEDGSAQVVIKYLIFAGDFLLFADELFPRAVANGAKFEFPLRFRLPGALTNFVAISLQGEPHITNKPSDPFVADIGAPVGTYTDLYAVTVTFAPEHTDRIETQTISIGAEFLNIGPQSTEFGKPDSKSSTQDAEGNSIPRANDAGAEVANESFSVPATKLVPTVEHSVTINNIVRPPLNKIRFRLGTLNSTVMPVLFNAVPETVMFLGISGRRQLRQDGFLTWTIEYRFSEKHIEEDGDIYGWNHFYNPQSGQFERLFKANGSLIYAQTSMTDLFDLRDDQVAALPDEQQVV